VEGQATAINYETHTVAGTIAHNTIQELPINGRSCLNLATLQPGVTVTTGVPAQFNSLINIQAGFSLSQRIHHRGPQRAGGLRRRRSEWR
jgi:hypothetical protein